MTGAVAVVEPYDRDVTTLFGGTEVGQADEMQLRSKRVGQRNLEALSAKFTLIYKSPPSIGCTVTGRYAGSLRKCWVELDGNDYIVTIADGRVDVVVLGASGATAGAPCRDRNVTPPHPSLRRTNRARIPAAALLPDLLLFPPAVPSTPRHLCAGLDFGSANRIYRNAFSVEGSKHDLGAWLEAPFNTVANSGGRTPGF
jgi:hypothetical protein